MDSSSPEIFGRTQKEVWVFLKHSIFVSFSEFYGVELCENMKIFETVLAFLKEPTDQAFDRIDRGKPSQSGCP